MFETLIVQPIFNILLVFYQLVGDFGLTIILFAVFVKVLMWPIARNQHQQTLKMRAIQPKLAEIKRKSKGNKQLEMMQTMDLYKKNDIKMSKSFVNALIQLPIFIAMFSVVRQMMSDPEAVSRHAYSIIKNFDRIKQIIENPASFKPTLLGLVDLSGRAFDFNGINSFILLLIVVAGAYIQYRLMNQVSLNPNTSGRKLSDILKDASEGKEADQSEINQIMTGKMNSILPVMLIFTFGGIYGALAYYSLINSIISVIQNKLILKNHVDDVANDTEIDMTISSRVKNAQAAQIVNEVKQKKTSQKTNSGVNITRIKAKRR